MAKSIQMYCDLPEVPELHFPADVSYAYTGYDASEFSSPSSWQSFEPQHQRTILVDGSMLNLPHANSHLPPIQRFIADTDRTAITPDELSPYPHPPLFSSRRLASPVQSSHESSVWSPESCNDSDGTCGDTIVVHQPPSTDCG